MPSSPMAGSNAHVRTDLLTVLARVPDPHDPRGVRFPLAGLLTIAVCTVLAGAKSFAAIGEFAADLDPVQGAGPASGRGEVQ